MIIKQLKFLISLCVLMFFASGCTPFGACGMGPLRMFRMNNETYFTRSGAENAHKEYLKEILAKTKKVSEPLADKCILVIPTYWWLRNSCVWSAGAANNPVGCIAAVMNREESMAYVIGVMERGLDTIYSMVEKSGLFRECEIVVAKDGNGEDEYIPTENTFVMKVWSESSVKCPFYLVSTNGKYEVIDFDLIVDSQSGWKKFAETIKKLQSN